MANTHIVFGKQKNGFNLDATVYTSQTIANNAVSANSDGTSNYVTVTAIGGPAWVAIAAAAATANAANTSNRIFVAQNETKELTVKGPVKVHTLDAS